MNRPAEQIGHHAHADPDRIEDESVETASLDRAGIIVAVNDAWLTFARNNGGDPTRTGVGASYLAACEAAPGDPGAEQVAAAIRAAIEGELPAPMTLRIPCDAPEQSRWFDVLISSPLSADGASVGATVILSRVPVEDASVVKSEMQVHRRAALTEDLLVMKQLADDDRIPVGFGANNTDVEPELNFPDLPRLQLEEALGQLTSHALNVLNAQGRLRAPLPANAAMASDLSLPVVLRQIVSAARDLVGARYAALGVVGRNGALEQFIHVGMDADLVRRIGDLPTGRGILGQLVSHPQPLRLTDLRDHPANSGFPKHHPPMGSFLGVPIRVRNQVFGNLYLTGCTHGEFSGEDEQLVTALASAAGSAIENARLFQETEQHRKWLAASTKVTQQLFAGDADQPLELVLRLAVQCAQADMANLVLPVGGDPAKGWSVHAAGGLLADAVAGQLINAESAVGQVIESGKPLLIEDYVSHVGDSGVYGRPGLGSVVGSMVLAPLLAGERVVGVLSVGRVAGRELFTDTDMDQLAVFAGHAGLALELNRARADRETLARVEDHDRIAADLHDHVIQELFATGMGLEGMVRALPCTEHQQRVLGYVDAIDSTIRRIRATIFHLQTVRHSNPEGLREALLTVLQAETSALGFPPSIEYTGLLETIPADLAEDVVAVVREALSNTARHAHATLATVRIGSADELVTVEVTDNGDGIGTTTRSSGQTNLRRRAEAHNGTLELSTPVGGGTELRWTGRLPSVARSFAR